MGHPIHYVTSVSQPWRKVKRAARQLWNEVDKDQATLIEQPPRLAHLEEKRWADSLLDMSQQEPIIVATFFELTLLRLLRKTRGENRLHVYVLDPQGLKELRIDDDGEFVDRWPEGFFDGRFEEVYGETCA